MAFLKRCTVIVFYFQSKPTSDKELTEQKRVFGHVLDFLFEEDNVVVNVVFGCKT